jgi:hypothetical protein
MKKQAPPSAALRKRRHQLVRGLPPLEQIVRGSRPPVHLQARRINNVIAYAVRFELPVQPKSFIAGLVARHHCDRSTHPRLTRARTSSINSSGPFRSHPLKVQRRSAPSRELPKGSVPSPNLMDFKIKLPPVE